MLEPKSGYVEEMNGDSIEDLTLDNDDLSYMKKWMIKRDLVTEMQ